MDYNHCCLFFSNQYQTTPAYGAAAPQQYGAQPQTAQSAPQAYPPPPTPDQYVIGGYTRPAAGQPTSAYYSQQQPGAYSSVSAGKSSQIRATAPSTAYPNYSGNTAGAPASNFQGFGQAQNQNQAQNPNSAKCKLSTSLSLRRGYFIYDYDI